MWYVIQVIAGQEHAIADLLERVIPQAMLEECFFPQYETEMKVRGTWVPCKKPMFPGYIIAVTDQPDALARELRRIPQFARVLSMGDVFVPLAAEEVALIGGFSSKGNRVVPMSHAIKDGDRVVVTSGPLVGCEGLIKQLNRSKSVAFLETEICGQKVAVRVGLSVVSATDTSEARALADARRTLAGARG